MKSFSHKLTKISLFLMTGLLLSNTNAYGSNNPKCTDISSANETIYSCVADSTSTDTTINQDLELAKKVYILNLGDSNLVLDNSGSSLKEGALLTKIALTKDAKVVHNLELFKSITSGKSAVKIDLKNKENSDPHQLEGLLKLNGEAGRTITVTNQEPGFPPSEEIIAGIETNIDVAGSYTIEANSNTPDIVVKTPMGTSGKVTTGIASRLRAPGELTINFNGSIDSSAEGLATATSGIRVLGETTIDELKGPVDLTVVMEDGSIKANGGLQTSGMRVMLEKNTAGNSTAILKGGKIEATNGSAFIAGVHAGSDGTRASAEIANNNATVIQEGGEVIVDYTASSSPLFPGSGFPPLPPAPPGAPVGTPPTPPMMPFPPTVEKPITAGLAAQINSDHSQGLAKVIQKAGSVEVREGSAPTGYDNDRNAAIFADGGSTEIRQSAGASLNITAEKGAAIFSRARNNDGLIEVAGIAHGQEASLYTLSKRGKTTTIKVADTADLQGEFAIYNNEGNTEISIAQQAVLGNDKVKSKISLNDGDDNLTFNNTKLDNLSLIDGGLDNDVTTDFDVLTLSGYGKDLDVVNFINSGQTTNWERYQLANAQYELSGSSVTVPSGAKDGKVAGLAVLDNAQVSFKEANFTVDGNLINKGTIDLRKDGADDYSILTVKHDYHGDNGIIKYNAKLKGDTTTPADKVVIEGNVYGNTILEVADRSGDGDQTIEGIQLIELSPTSQVENSATAFTLARAVDVGIYEYNALDLQAGAGNKSGLYLKSKAQGSSNQLYRQAVVGYSLNSSVVNQALYSITTNLHQRMGEQRTQTNLIHPDQSWVRVMHNQNHLEVAQLKSDNNDFGIQIGWDLDTDYQDETKTRTGIYGQYTKVESHLGDTFRANHNIPGMIDTDIGSIGLYRTIYRNQNYLDLVGSLHYIYSDYEVKNGGDQRGFGGTVSAEVGRKIPFKTESKYFFEPQAQLSYQITRYGSFTDTLSSIEGFTNHSLRPRLGFRLGYSNFEGNHLWLHANLEWELLKKSYIVIDDKVISTKANSSTWYNVGLNGQLLLSPTTVFYSSLEYRSSLKDRKSFHGLGAEMGLRFTW